MNELTNLTPVILHHTANAYVCVCSNPYFFHNHLYSRIVDINEREGGQTGDMNENGLSIDKSFFNSTKPYSVLIVCLHSCYLTSH